MRSVPTPLESNIFLPAPTESISTYYLNHEFNLENKNLYRELSNYRFGDENKNHTLHSRIENPSDVCCRLDNCPSSNLQGQRR